MKQALIGVLNLVISKKIIIDLLSFIRFQVLIYLKHLLDPVYRFKQM